MSVKEKIVVLDFGGQYNQLIARRVRESGVYCEILNYAAPVEQWRDGALRGVILTGGPNSVYAPGAPRPSAEIFALGGAGAGHLLRDAADQRALRRQGGVRRSRRIRPHAAAHERRGAVSRRRPRDGGVHEPHRPRQRAARGLPDGRLHGQLPHRGVFQPRARPSTACSSIRRCATPSRERRC